ncbi:ABC transporter ATP-binding protein, partial [Poseidonibacter sp.]|uniref:ABC transporter ATP-binding protein n=1 Tax=Poseidonibacter sp. TaxID=2321188 RepID=UPI003C77D3BF
IYHLIALKLFENYLGMSYSKFISKNSSELNKMIISESKNFTILLSSLLVILTESLIILFIYSFMIYINYKLTLMITFFLMFCVFILLIFTSRKIKKAGTNREEQEKSFYETINSSFRNFKIIKLKSYSNEVLINFESSINKFIQSFIFNETMSNLPRLFLEAIAFSVVILIIVFHVYTNETNVVDFVGVLSVFVIGLYRLMPSLNRIITAYQHILYNHKTLDIVHNDIMYKNEDILHKDLTFSKFITLRNISFEYNKNHLVLDSINLSINKGESIAFIGESGSGKSTLVDIIIGLVKQKTGELLIDNIFLTDSNVNSWKKKIGYIPQVVYLFDGTIAENIAFGSIYNEERVKEVLIQTNLYDFVVNYRNGIHTLVGDAGIKFSGGQLQRIAIARALYDDPEVIVLDEATSALDPKTERMIMNEIFNLSGNKTLIIIAHKLTALNNCDNIYKLDKGKLSKYEI